MMKKLTVFFTLVFLAASSTSAWAATAPVRKTAQHAAVTAKKARKTVQTKTKRARKLSYAVSHPAFSAKAAAQAQSADGKKPPAGYMEALKKAEDRFFSARAAARGDKAQLSAAEEQYDRELAAAQAMLIQP